MSESVGLQISDDMFGDESCDECTRIIKESFLDAQIREIGQNQSVVHRVDASVFHAALTRDDHFVHRVLRNLEPDEAEYILNALVDYTSPEFGNNTRTQLPEFGKTKSYPMVSALVSLRGNQNLLRELVDFKLDLTKKDDAGNSLLHHLVDISEDNPKNALCLYDVIQELLPIDELKDLVHARNFQKETALDIASRRWLPEMMHAILNTNNVYKFILEETGTFNHFCYDLTEFEVTKRANGITPLCHLSVMPENRLQRLDDFQLLSREPIATSIEEVLHVGKKVTWFWLVSWCLTATLYIPALFYTITSSDTQMKNILNYLIILLSLAASISEIASIPAIWPYVKLIIRNLRGRQHPVAMVFFYRSLQFFFCWNVFVTHCIHLTGLPLVCSSMTLQYIFLFSQLCNIFNGVFAPQDWYFSSNAYPLLIIIIYLASTVFNTVMLFNLMVAIMNHRVTELCVHTKSLVKLAQLSIYLFVELKINSTRKLLKFGSHSRKRCLFDGVDGEKFFMYTVEPVTVPPEEES
ncbi:hypothetical protein CAPTEDRAFT_215735 [Capitella teleta]|uniref:Ion transport domain-containing protein n=1 Tax=Capitella teleta TaxID=283909 RepID=R7VHL8_CAPTE|nr:hypothetical protein CAPTEDRAFT_215735 [Capitella teleta]|eukprot:ELU15791.1 hypothetical protein CAPTEDRAFT_215735 [Capitella teleta]